MRIQAWTPNFKPDEETSIVPVQISLPELPWHCYNKAFVTALLAPIGTVLYLDTTSIQKTRESVAKVKVHIDLIKDRPSYIWMGLDEEDIIEGRWQSIQYEGILDYCLYCKHQDHLEHVCTIKQRDQEYKRRKEIEADKGKTRAKVETKEQQSRQQAKTDNGKQQEGQIHAEASTFNEAHHQFQQNANKILEDQWQTQKRRNGKGKNVHQQKKVYRPVSPQKKGGNNSQH